MNQQKPNANEEFWHQIQLKKSDRRIKENAFFPVLPRVHHQWKFIIPVGVVQFP